MFLYWALSGLDFVRFLIHASKVQLYGEASSWQLLGLRGAWDHCVGVFCLFSCGRGKCNLAAYASLWIGQSGGCSSVMKMCVLLLFELEVQHNVLI